MVCAHWRLVEWMIMISMTFLGSAQKSQTAFNIPGKSKQNFSLFFFVILLNDFSRKGIPLILSRMPSPAEIQTSIVLYHTFILDFWLFILWRKDSIHALKEVFFLKDQFFSQEETEGIDFRNSWICFVLFYLITACSYILLVRISKMTFSDNFFWTDKILMDLPCWNVLISAELNKELCLQLPFTTWMCIKAYLGSWFQW